MTARWRHPRIRRLGAVAALAVLAVTVQVGATATNASWNEREWTQAGVGTSDCTEPGGLFATRGEGRVLSGSLLGIDLDSLAEASGVEVTNDGTRSLASPAGAGSAGPDAYADPLNVVALNAVAVDLSDVLQLPLDNSTGVLGQYAQAQSSGDAAGAAGFITSSGGIALEPQDGYPDLATLRLSTLLDALGFDLGTLLAGVSDVSLEVGAITGRAALDGCALLWGATDAVTREYLAASLQTVVTSPTVGDLVSAVQGTVSTLQATVAGLTTDEGLASGIESGVAALLTPLLGVLGLDVDVDVNSASIDLSGVDALLTADIGDPGGVLTIDLDGGTVRIDTAALLAAAYPGQYSDGLNALPPNTNPLSDPVVVNALTAALTSTLAAWVESVEAALFAAIDSMLIDVSVEVDVTTGVIVPILVLRLTATVIGPLSALVVNVQSQVFGGLPAGLLTNLVEALLNGLGPLVKSQVEGILDPLVTQLISTTLPGATAPVIAAVSGVYDALFLDGVVAATLNAQNDPATGGPEPSDWASVPTGEYRVAGIRVGVLDTLGDLGARLYLGQGAVGPACSPTTAPVECSGY